MSAARFQIKLAKWPTPNRVVLADRSRPAFRGQYPTIEAACRAMDNTIRRERNVPARIDIPILEVRAAMTALRAARAYNNPGVHSHDFGEDNYGCPVCDPLGMDTIVPEHHGQHLQGCRACDAYADEVRIIVDLKEVIS